jgi:hypothetical protein
MSNLAYHPAPGLGDLLTGYYVVPQNPLQMAQEGVSVKPALGDFVAASFVVPQNPLLAQITGTVAPIGQGAAGTPLMRKKRPTSSMSGLGGCGCGCSGGGGGCGGGMGTLSTDLSQFTSDLTSGNISQAIFTDTISGIPVYVIAALAVGTMYLLGAGEKSGTGRGKRNYA